MILSYLLRMSLKIACHNLILYLAPKPILIVYSFFSTVVIFADDGTVYHAIFDMLQDANFRTFKYVLTS